MGHLWDLSPPFFILVWDVKRIVQSSVKNFSSISASFVLASSVLFQSYKSTGRKFHELPEENKDTNGVSLPFIMKVKVPNTGQGQNDKIIFSRWDFSSTSPKISRGENFNLWRHCVS